MSFSTQDGARSGWSAVVDGLAYLVQVATAAATAKLMQDPTVAPLLPRGFVALYSLDPDVAREASNRFNDAVAKIGIEYQGLQVCMRELQGRLRLTGAQAHALTWQEARRLNMAHDCGEIDRLRYQAGQHLARGAILQAQAVSAVTAYLENIGKAHVCPPHVCDTFPPPGAVFETAPPYEVRTEATPEQAGGEGTHSQAAQAAPAEDRKGPRGGTAGKSAT